jgi:hypothetical protein
MPRIGQVRHVYTRPETEVLEWASPEQKEVFEYGPAPVCASGGFGASKTWAMVMKGILLSDCFPRNRGVIVRKVFTELQKTTMATFYKVLPSSAYLFGGRRADSEKYLRLNNGSEVLFMHLDDPDVANVIKGLEINWFFIDQAEEIEEEIFDKLKSRLGRWDGAEVPDHIIQREVNSGRKWEWLNTKGRPIPPTFAMLACNPDTKQHWIYRRFHPDSEEFSQLREDGQGGKTSYQLEGYKMVTMSSLTNKFLTQQNRKELLTQDKSFINRYVHGTWGIPEGLIHNPTELSKIPGTRDLVAHLIRSCTLHRTLDHGDTAPTCCAWWAVDKEGNIFLFREYYKPDQLISYHRAEIKALSGTEGYVFNLADPSIFVKTQQKYGGKWSIADDYLDPTLGTTESMIYWEPADNNELVTRGRINEYLRVDPDRVHPITKQKGSPRLFFIMKSVEHPFGCDFTWKQTGSQMRLKVGTEMGKPVYSDERDETVTDHAYDVVRYFVASRPPVAGILQARVHHNTFEATRQRVLEFHRRGGAKQLQRRVRTLAGGTRSRGY